MLYSTCATFELVKIPEYTLCGWLDYKPLINNNNHHFFRAYDIHPCPGYLGPGRVSNRISHVDPDVEQSYSSSINMMIERPYQGMYTNTYSSFIGNSASHSLHSFCLFSVTFDWKKFKIDEAKVSVCVCVCVCMRACMCGCLSQTIPRKLLKSSNLARWLPQT